MHPFSSWFRCAEGCDFRAALTEVVYQCPRCDGLLEVEHDLAALRQRTAAEWKQLFEDRFRGGRWPYGSGVWGKKEWVYPELADANVVSMGEGASPLLRVDRYARDIGLGEVWVKQCGTTHTGSFKDLGMTVLVSAVREMQARGSVIRAVACASTGDTSAALAAYCAGAGIPSVVLLPRGKISTAQLVQPISNGALVLELDTDFDGCMRVVKELARTKDIYLANSMNSLRIEGQKTVAIEIAQQLGWRAPDWVVIPGGNLGNSSAMGKGFRHAAGARARRPAAAPGGGAGRGSQPAVAQHHRGRSQADPGREGRAHPGREDAGQRHPDRRPRLGPARAAGARRRWTASSSRPGSRSWRTPARAPTATGLFTCPHTAVALASLEKLASRGVVKPGEQVVVVSTAHGLKFSDFKTGYHDGTLPGLSSPLRNPGVKLPATIAAVQDAITARFGRG